MQPDLIQKRRESNYKVFKRWSRKSYAAFASMHQEIKISCMNASYSLLTAFESRFVPSFENGINEFRMKSEDPDIPLPEESQWMTPLVELQKQADCPKSESSFYQLTRSYWGISTTCYRPIQLSPSCLSIPSKAIKGSTPNSNQHNFRYALLNFEEHESLSFSFKTKTLCPNFSIYNL